MGTLMIVKIRARLMHRHSDMTMLLMYCINKILQMFIGIICSIKRCIVLQGVFGNPSYYFVAALTV